MWGEPHKDGKRVGRIQHAIWMFALLACTADPRVIEVQACEVVAFDSARQWTLEGATLFGIQDERGVRFVAPAVARTTTLTLVSDDETRVSVIVQPHANADAELGLAKDCPPFPYGVASGDPDQTSIVLWTHYEGTGALHFEVSESPRFADVIVEGESPSGRVEARGLQPDTTYFYRFRDEQSTSRVGRTRTAPNHSNHARFAIASCSSLFSGYFNAYRRLAERELDAVIHLGDYVYDTIDPQEEVRVPTPRPDAPRTLDAWRRRHELYLSDPDLRAARAAHPWVVVWDDHDLAGESDAAAEAFREYVPIRPETSQIYRALRWGSLTSLILLDVTHHRGEDQIPGTTAPSILGQTQFRWFQDQIASADSVWRLVGSQKLVAPLLGVGDLADDTWNGFPESRERVTDELDRLGINNVLFVSGDLHFTVFGEVPGPDYDATTGIGSRRAEVLGPSITRGNLDESVPDPRLREGLTRAYSEANSHFVDADLTNHGYVLLDIDANMITATAWYSPIDVPAEIERIGPQHTLHAGERRWSR